jgi:hypothetical protein
MATITHDGLKLCPDCMIAAVNGDFTGLDNLVGWKCLTCHRTGLCETPTHCPSCCSEGRDNHGPHSAADLRMAAITAGLERLGGFGHLVMTSTQWGRGHDEFSRAMCACCRDAGHGERFEFAILGADDLLRDDERRALQRYATANGRTWKSQLSLAWSTCADELEDDCGPLRSVRNRLGPSWLYGRKNKIRP